MSAKINHAPATGLALAVSAARHKQGTIILEDGQPLALVYGETFDKSQQDAAYLVHAARAYPRLVAALQAWVKTSRSFCDRPSLDQQCELAALNLLRDLGEPTS